MKTLYKVALVLALISFGYAISAWENQEYVQLSSDIHSLAYISNIVADSRTAGAETRPSVYTVKLDNMNSFPFGDPDLGFWTDADFTVANSPGLGEMKKDSTLAAYKTGTQGIQRDDSLDAEYTYSSFWM